MVDDDSKTNSSDDSIVSSEPKLKKMKMDNLEDDNNEEGEVGEDGESDNEEEDEEMDVVYERKASELSDEALLDYFILYPGMPLNEAKTKEEKLPKLRKYLKEVEDSDGFNIDNFPGFQVPLSGLTNVIPHYLLPDIMKPDAYYNDLAEWAIEDYNEKNGTGYGDVQFEKVNLTISCYFTYYLTFTAIDVGMNAAGSDDKIDARKTFQALMMVNMIDTEEDPDVKFCRLKHN